MKKYFEILRKCSLFDNIEDESLISLLLCLGASVKTYKKKEAIIEEGEPTEILGIVLSGTAKIERTDFYGNRSIIATLSPSELFGEAFACADVKNTPVNVISAENSEIMLINCKKIINSCSNACGFHNRLIVNLLKIVATKNIILNQKSEIISRRTTRERLMAYLLFQAKKNGCDSFTIPFNRQELADFLEVDRSGLSAEISKLRNEGILFSHRSHFKLLKNAFQK